MCESVTNMVLEISDVLYGCRDSNATMSSKVPRVFPIELHRLRDAVIDPILNEVPKESEFRTYLEPISVDVSSFGRSMKYTYYSADLLELLIRYVSVKHKWLTKMPFMSDKTSKTVNDNCYHGPSIDKICVKCPGCSDDIAYYIETLFLKPIEDEEPLCKGHPKGRDGIHHIIYKSKAATLKNMLSSKRLVSMKYLPIQLCNATDEIWSSFHIAETNRLNACLYSIGAYRATVDVSDLPDAEEIIDKYELLASDRSTARMDRCLSYVTITSTHTYSKKIQEDAYTTICKEYELMTRHKLIIGSERRLKKLEARAAEIVEMKSLRSTNPNIRFVYDHHKDKYLSY
jgi:hypothetical protein